MSEAFRLEVDHSLRGDRRVRKYHHPALGLTVLLLRDTSAPLISYQTWFAVGSADESPGKTGLAHFFEHLMFTQTTNRGSGEFDRLIESCGGDTNAATWLDWTYYRNSVPSGELGMVIDLEQDRMAHLDLSTAVVENEREVILNERRERVEDDVDGYLDEMLMKEAFGDHPYGWPTIGWMQDIKNLSIDDLTSFYRRYYSPDNATIIVVGDIDERETLEAIDGGYGWLADRKSERRSRIETSPSKRSGRHLCKKPVSADRGLFGWIGPGQNDPQWAALEVVSHVLAGGPSARLHTDLVIGREMATTAGCSMLPLRQAGFFEVSVHATAEHSMTECEKVVDEHIARLADELVGDDELAKVRAGMLTDFWSDLVTVDGKAESFGHHDVVCGDFRKLLAFPAIVEAITADEVREAVRTFLTSESKCVAIATPE